MIISHIFIYFYFFLDIECLVPFLEANIHVYPKQEKYTPGDVLQFSCRQGLVRIGPDSVQCYHFGWSPNFPTCKGQYLF